MKDYLLDTNIIISFLRNKEGVAVLKTIDTCKLFVSSIVIAEFYLGAYLSNQKQKEINGLSDFLDKGRIFIVPIDENIAKKYGELQAFFTKHGKKKPVFDLLIAATCLVNNLSLVTLNKKDFEGIEGLKIY